MFGVLYAAEGSAPEVLAEVAREFSPRIEVCGAREIALDLSGLTRLFGDSRSIAEELRRTAADRGLRVRVAIAGTCTAARLLVRHRAGLTVIEPGCEAAAVAPLSLTLLAALEIPNPQSPIPNHRSQITDHKSQPRTTHSPPPFDTFRRWGLRTLGDVAALPADDVAARLGREGPAWQRLARGEDPHPLVPAALEERFEQALDLEWPIEGLEPLSFVLGRLMEPLSAHLERRDRGAAVLHVRLHLVTRMVHERSLQLPTPIRDARTLRTLVLLDLESHPPPAAIDRVIVTVDPTPGRVVQFSLLTRPLPSPEQISTLMARLHALMGEDRCGSPAIVDSWQPGAFAIQPFAPSEANVHEPRRHGGTEKDFQHLRVFVSPWSVSGTDVSIPVVALRRFRFPVPARVRMEGGKPERVTTDRRGLSGGRMEACAGPWRTSGGWWAGGSRKSQVASDKLPPAASDLPLATCHWRIAAWDRDEWDVTLNDGATYRLFRERDADRWYVEGIVD